LDIQINLSAAFDTVNHNIHLYRLENNQIAYHSYADDTQIYLALSPNDYSPIDSLGQCIDEVNSWMCQNFLQLNQYKDVLKVKAYLDARDQTIKIK